MPKKSIAGASFETLEAWAGVLLVIGAALLLYATLKIQLAHAIGS
jgi:hypothetical protein